MAVGVAPGAGPSTPHRLLQRLGGLPLHHLRWHVLLLRGQLLPRAHEGDPPALREPQHLHEQLLLRGRRRPHALPPRPQRPLQVHGGHPHHPHRRPRAGAEPGEPPCPGITREGLRAPREAPRGPSGRAKGTCDASGTPTWPIGTPGSKGASALRGRGAKDPGPQPRVTDPPTRRQILFDQMQVDSGFSKDGVRVLVMGATTMSIDIPAAGVSVTFDGQVFHIQLSYGRDRKSVV